MVIPTEKEIIEHAKSFYNDEIAKELGEKFFLRYDSQGWVLGNGRPMVRWQSAFKLWVMSYEAEKSKNKKGFQKNTDGDGFEVIR